MTRSADNFKDFKTHSNNYFQGILNVQSFIILLGTLSVSQLPILSWAPYEQGPAAFNWISWFKPARHFTIPVNRWIIHISMLSFHNMTYEPWFFTLFLFLALGSGAEMIIK